MRWRVRAFLSEPAQRHPDRPFGDARRRALAVLADPRAARRDVVGALGALADVGLRSDVGPVRTALTDPRPRVREEAARILTLLER